MSESPEARFLPEEVEQIRRLIATHDATIACPRCGKELATEPPGGQRRHDGGGVGASLRRVSSQRRSLRPVMRIEAVIAVSPQNDGSRNLPSVNGR